MTKEILSQPVPIYSRDPDAIIKKTHPDGSVTFHAPNSDKEIGIFEDSLADTFYSNRSKLRLLVDMLDDEDFGTFGCLVEAVIESYERQLEEVFYFIHHDIGRIMCSFVMRDNWPHRTGRVVSVELEKAAPSKEAQP